VRERAVQEAALRAIEEGLLQSAHDTSDGGLCVALAECCFSSLNRAGLGAEVELAGDASAAAQLFGETPSRIVVSFEESARARVEEIAAAADCPFGIIGRTGGARLRIAVNGRACVSQDVGELERIWRGSLPEKLQAEVLAAAAE
jgi:phosphoribosylformylglycinamidine synthase